MENIGAALILAFAAGISTGIGGLVIFFVKKFKHEYLSLCMGFSAGVMIYISLVEMLGMAAVDIGFLHENIAFFLGILFIYLVDFLVPHQYKEEYVKKRAVCGKEKYLTAGVFVAFGIAIHNFPEGIAIAAPIYKE